MEVMRSQVMSSQAMGSQEIGSVPNRNFWYYHNRLDILERWKEIAVRPEKKECYDEDVDLIEQADDDLIELEKRCQQARSDMNQHLEDIEEEAPNDADLVSLVSTIPDAGLGLFYKPKQQATQESCIREGEVLCYCGGHIHSFRSSSNLQDRRYLLLVAGNLLVDAAPLLQIKARYINDPLNEKYVNCKFVPDPSNFRSAVVATRKIEPGEELFISYGEAYWAHHGDGGRRKA